MTTIHELITDIKKGGFAYERGVITRGSTTDTNYEDITRLMIYFDFGADLDLSHYTNLKKLYIHGVRDTTLTNVNPGIEVIALHQCDGLFVPYIPNIKEFIYGESMMNYGVLFTSLYHKYQSDEINWCDIVEQIFSSYKFKNESFEQLFSRAEDMINEDPLVI